MRRRRSKHHNDLAELAKDHIAYGIELLVLAAEKAQLVRDEHVRLSDHHALAATEASADANFHADVIDAVSAAFYGPEPTAP